MVFSLVKDSGLFATAKLINVISAFIIFGYIARNFNPESLGKIDFISTLIVFIVNTAIFGQGSSLGRLINDPIEVKEKRILATNSLILQLAALFIMLGLLVITDNYFSIDKFIFNNSHALKSVVLIQIPFVLATEICLGALLWNRFQKFFALITILSSLSSCVFLVITFEIFKIDITILNVFRVYLVARSLVAAISIHFCIKQRIFSSIKSIDFAKMNDLLKIAIPLGLLTGVGTILPLWQRVLIKSYLQEYNLGLFALSAKIVSVITVLGASFNNAWGPIYIKSYQEKDIKRIFIFVFKSIGYICSIIILLISINAADLVKILGDSNYNSASLLILPLSIGLCLEILQHVTEIGIFISKKSFYYLISYLLFVLCFTIVFMLSVKHFGFISIGWSLAISYLVKTIFMTLLSQRFYKVNWPYNSIMLTMGTSIGFSYMYYINLFTSTSTFLILIISISLVTYFFISNLSNYELVLIKSVPKIFYKKLCDIKDSYNSKDKN